jgi:hypothetical protein
LAEGLQINEETKLKIANMDFSKWVIKQKTKSLLNYLNSVVVYLRSMGKLLSKDRLFPINDHFLERSAKWQQWKYFFIKEHWYEPKLKRKFIQKIKDYSPKKINNNECPKDVRRPPKKINIEYFKPVFAMNYNTDPKEKIYLEISKLYINMWELLELFETISYVSSWLINVWYFCVGHRHPLYKIPCYLKELYLDNCSFEGLSLSLRLADHQTWVNKAIAMKLFIKQLTYVEFRKSFRLYFENLDVYFLAWSVIFRHNWKGENLGTEFNKFLRNISKVFCIRHYNFRFFSHAINLFYFSEIKRCIEIQQKTWMMLKSKILVIWSWWVTIPMLYLWIFQKLYFKKLVFYKWIVNIPENLEIVVKLASALKKVVFIRCWFIRFTVIETGGEKLNVKFYPNTRSISNYEGNLALQPFYENALKRKIISRRWAETYVGNFLRRAGLKKLKVRMKDWDFYEKRMKKYFEMVNFPDIIENGCVNSVHEFM